jgi:uncharacterized membrane protein YsdA (DUF1294 family)
MSLEASGLEALRKQALEQARTRFADDVLSMDEYAEQVGAILAATSSADLQAFAPTEVAPVQIAGQQRRTSNFIVSIFGGNDRKGRWRVPERMTVLTIFGGTKLDLRAASTSEHEVRISSFSAFGGLEVIVPEGVDVELSGFALFGGNHTEVAAVPVLPGTPVVRVRAIAVFGGATVKSQRSKPEKRKRSKC